MQNFVIINNLSFTYPNAAEPLFDHVSVQCQSGWTGIVGPNGGGKTTLLKLINRELKPDRGDISSPELVFYAEQRMDDMPQELADFLHSFKKSAIRIKDQLQIRDDWSERWESLSFGERKRCQIGVALAKEPDVLLLDEPSNHLDHSSKLFLIGALMDFRGVGLLVSHDRDVLDTLCSHTLFVEPPEFDLRACAYSIAVQEREREQEALRHEREIMKKEVKKLKRRAQQQRQKADTADKQRSKRGIAAKDHDAKAKIDLARFTGKDGVAGRLYERTKARLQRAEEHQQAIRVKKKFDLGISYAESGHSHKFPIIIPTTTLQMGEASLHVPELSLSAGEKIGLIGDNGSGKSTFVTFLTNSLPFQTDQMIYIPQEIPTDAIDRIVQRIYSLSDADKGDIMTIIRRLGSEPTRVLVTSAPSPGEVRKLLLAKGLQKNPALIIMDEPTNHMDLPSIRCLEEALSACGCALLLVSHDYVFLQQVVSFYWSFERKGLVSKIEPKYSI
jgi:ATPase subunit of ABC transporter with duplicated ATPase domains